MRLRCAAAKQHCRSMLPEASSTHVVTRPDFARLAATPRCHMHVFTPLGPLDKTTLVLQVLSCGVLLCLDFPDSRFSAQDTGCGEAWKASRGTAGYKADPILGHRLNALATPRVAPGVVPCPLSEEHLSLPKWCWANAQQYVDVHCRP